MASLFTLIPVALGLSTDAFAASIARGGRERRLHIGKAVSSGAIFGTTEGLMCAIGWSAAFVFADLIQAVDHWIALALLVIIGGKMIREGLETETDDPADADTVRNSNLAGTIITAIGTSIDSAAVGIALALSGVSLWSALVIGLFSFTASTIGFMIGPMVGERLGKRAEIAGGVILILLGLWIFYSHMTGAA